MFFREILKSIFDTIRHYDYTNTVQII